MNAAGTARLLPFVLLAVASAYAFEAGVTEHRPPRAHRLVLRTRGPASVAPSVKHEPPAWYW
jgi:hypothetical protein